MTTATCPVCNTRILLEERGRSFLGIAHTVPWFLSQEKLFEAVVQGTFHDSHSSRDKIHWACDNCLDQGKALLADPTVQTFCDCVPYYAYFDLYFECSTCGKRFLFSVTEQKFWYETRKFWVQSQAKDCVNCRREKRRRKRLIKQREDIASESDH